MATPFRLKRSAVADRRPTTTDLQLGELALNTHDGFLYAETTGVGSTVSLLTPWREQYGSPTSIYYNHRVGIGSTNPTVSLDVVGDTIFQSNLDVAGIGTIGSGASGQAILQYQGTTRLTTQTWGVQGTGTVQAIGDLQAVNTVSQTDGKNIHITNLKSGGGTKNVLTLSHASNNSFITGHVGNISINAPQVSISTNFSVGGISTFTNTVNINGVIEANSNLNVDGNLDVDGHTELDNLRVSGISTFNDSIDANGNLNVSGISTFSDGIFIPDDKKLEIGNAAGSGDLQLFYDSTPGESFISHTGPGVFKIQGNGGNNTFLRAKEAENSITLVPNGGVILHYDGGVRAETTQTGVDITNTLNVVGLGTFGDKVKISSNVNALSNPSVAGNYHLHITNPQNDAGETVGIAFGLSTGGDIGASITHEREGSNSVGNLRFYTKENTSPSSMQERMRITNDGKVGINSTSPTSKLDVITDGGGGIKVFVPKSSSYKSGLHILNGDFSDLNADINFEIKNSESKISTNIGASLVLATNGNEALRIDPFGRVGIAYTLASYTPPVSPGGLYVQNGIFVDNFGIYVKSGISTFSDTVKIGTGVTALTDGNVSIGGTFEIFDLTGITNRNFSQFKLSNFSISQHQNTGAYKIINSSTGHLLLGGGIGGNGGIVFYNNSLGAKYFRANSEGSVEIFHDNVLRFETSGIGATVYGQLDTTDLNVSGVSTFQGAIDANGDLDVDGNTELDDVNVSGNLSVAEKIIHAGDTDSFIKFTDNQIDIQTNAANKVRIGAGASIGIHEDAIRAVTIATGNQNNVLIRPNNGASNGMGNSDAVNNLIVMRVPYGESAASQSNAGLRVGMMMRLYNGNAGFGDIDPSKSASLYAVSEDPSEGYSRIVGLSFYTSSFNSSQTEKLRISGSGNVGIGTSGPTHKLEVNGNTLLKDNLTVSGISTFGNNVKVLDGALTIEGVTPQLIFNDTTGSPDYKIRKQSGHFMIMETGQTNDSEWRLSIRSGGTIDIPGNLDTHGNLDVDGRTELDVTNISETLNVTGISTFRNIVSITAPESTDAILELIADEGDDNTDKWRIRSDATGNNLKFETYASGSWSDGTPLRIASNGYVTIAGALVVDKVNINDNVIQLNSGTDDLKIRGNGTGGTNHLTLDDDITVAGTATFEDDLTVSGISTFSSVINANQGINLTEFDNKSILLGASDDMRIRHTGSHSEITDEGQGSLRLGGNNVVIGSATFGVTMATFAQGGAVKLYNNDNLRLETTNTGVSITDNLNVAGISTFVGNVYLGNDVYFNTANNGDIQFDTSDNSLKIGYNQGLNDQVKLKFGSSGTFQIFKHSVSGAFIDNGGGNFYIRNKSGFPLHLMANATDEGVLIKNNAEVELYYDDEIRFETTAYGALLTGGTSGIGTIAGPATFHIDPVTVGDNTGTVVIKGNLQVDGTTTTINSTTVSVDDKNLELGSGAANDAAANGGGITIVSGEGNKTFQFEATGDNLGSSEHINIATGKVYKVNNVETLSATTLGSAVVNSSLTNLGTLTSLDVNGNLNVSGIATLGSGSSGQAILEYQGTTRLKTEVDRIDAFGHFNVGGNVDNALLRLGQSNDLVLTHDGDQSFINNLTSNLNINAPTVVVGTGLSVVGVSTFSDGIFLPDNKKAEFGNAVGNANLEIFHDGSSHSYVRTANASAGGIIIKSHNDLQIRTDNLQIKTNSLDNVLTSDINGNVSIGNSLSVAGISTFSGDVHIGSAVLTNPAGTTVDFNGSITASDVVTAGALLHEGDTDTLVHFSAANTIELKTGGFSRLSVNNFGVALQTNATFNVNGGRIILGDSTVSTTDDRIVLGNSDDCFLYHDSTDTFIENNTGILKILGNTIQLGDGTDKVGINSTSPTHELEVLGDSSLKGNLTVSGISTFTGNVIASNLLVSRDGNATINILDTGHGFNATTLGLTNGGRDFAITAPRDIRLRPSGGLNGIVIENNGPVELYHANVKKAATSASGLDVTGNISCTGTVDIDGQVGFGTHITLEDYGEIQLGEKSGGDLKIYHDPTMFGSVYNVIESTNGNFFFVNKDTTNKYMYIRSNDIQLRDWSNNHAYIHCIMGGEVELYYANQRRIETTSTGAVIIDSAVSGSGISCNLDLYNNGNNNGDGSSLSFKRSPGNTRAQIIAVKNETSNNETDLVFKTTKNAGALVESLRIKGDTQRVGIGTDDPEEVLHVLQSGTTAAEFRLENNEGYLLLRADSNVATYGAEQHLFHNRANNEEYLRIDSSGRVLIGTTTEGHPNADNLTIATSGDTGITIRSGTTHNGRIYFSDATSGTGEVVGSLDYDHNNDSFSIITDSELRLRIDSSGRLLLGTTTEGHPNADDLTIATDGDTGITIRSGTTHNGRIYFSDAESGTGEVVGSLDYDHNDNKFSIFTNGGERLRIDGSGNVSINSGLTVSGISTFNGINNISGEVNIGDSATGQTTNRLRIGASADIQIYHDSSTTNNHFIAQNGLFYLQNDNLRITALNAAKPFIQGNVDSFVKLFYAGNEKISTSGIGATVYGQLDSTQLTVSGVSTFTGTGHFNSGELRINGTNVASLHFNSSTNNPDYRVQNHSGELQLYDATNDKYRFIAKTNGRVGINTHNPLRDFHVVGTSRFEQLDVVGFSTFGSAGTRFYHHTPRIEMAGSGTATISFCNATTGTTNTDGMLMGFSSNSQVGFINVNESGHGFVLKTGSSAESSERIRVSGVGTFSIRNGTEEMVNARPNLGVELYFNGIKRLETTGTGVDITDNLSVAGIGTVQSLSVKSNTTNVAATIFSNASVSSHDYGHGVNGSQNQGLTIKAPESCIELISTAGGLHAGSILLRDSSNDGFGFVNDPTNKELRLKSFTTSGNNFFITASGSNTSRLDDCIVIKKDGSVKLFNDGNKRLETTGTGVDITDNLNVAGITTSAGVINSQTDIRINNVSVIETALNDAVAMAIALG